MKTESIAFDIAKTQWSSALPAALDSSRTLVLAFGAPELVDDQAPLVALARAFPRSVVVGCSSAGEIHGGAVHDRSLAVTVTRFDRSDLSVASTQVRGPLDSRAAGQALAKKLLAARPALRAVLVFSEGLAVNGSELVRGMNGALDPSIVVTGGLAADGAGFQRTWVSLGAMAQPNMIVAVGLYGAHLVVGHGSKGGWDRFGPERVVTRSEGNVLFELDGKPALALYEEYLGERARDLPASGLLFPLAVRSSSKDEKFLVRTLLSVDRAKQSLSFAGDVPTGYLAQLMRADFDKLVDGAGLAGKKARGERDVAGDTLAIAISCVGRRLVLGERSDEEVEAVLASLPPKGTSLTGFYSYGEIAPYDVGHSDLHNQTMTLTVIREAAAVAVAGRANPVEAGNPALPTAFGNLRPKAVQREASPAAEPRLLVDGLSYSISEKKWSGPFPPLDSPRTLVLAFGAPEVARDPAPLADLARAYPRSIVVGCSGAGEVHGTEVRDGSIAVTVTRFAETDLSFASTEVANPDASRAAGVALARKLSAARPGLRAVLVLSEGLHVNGSELARGLRESLDPKVIVTGGLAGDGARFERTWVAIGGKIRQNTIAAVGLYGDHVVVSHGSKGGWDRFGPERIVTRSEGNVVYELDGKPALALYRDYLGERAKDLPASGLLFPLSVRASQNDERRLVRTLLSVDHDAQSLTFAGDVAVGSLAQLMRADFDKLIDGAGGAAAMSEPAPENEPSLVVAISCVGRRLVLGDRTEEEVEAVMQSLPRGGAGARLTGFYSYGEISPYVDGSTSVSGPCELHNQTMTLTVISEQRSTSRTKAVEPRTSERLRADTTSEVRALAHPLAARPAPPLPPRATAPAALSRSAAPVDATTGLVVRRWSYDLAARAWSLDAFPRLDSPRTLVLAFGDAALLDDPSAFARLSAEFPSSIVVGCSSAGEIHDAQVKDGSLSVTATRFVNTDLSLASFEVQAADDSRPVGRALAKRLLGARPGLRAVLVLSDGLGVNGSELVRGINETLASSVVVTGGLAGDGSKFSRTWVGVDGRVARNVVAAVGFYGDHVVVGHGSKGGWDTFGPERVVTRSEGNVLYEIDGKPALALYKEYLGERAKDLPASGLLFPLAMRSSAKDEKVLVRTLLAVDHERASMTFAGDVPRGHLVQLMRADTDKLLDGAAQAAAVVARGLDEHEASLTIAISCVGRRLVLGDRTDEEIEAVKGTLPGAGARTELTGFYSYGEISPYSTGHCDLHNQTMTVTVISESATALSQLEQAEDPTRMRPSRPVAAAAAAAAVPLAYDPRTPVAEPSSSSLASIRVDETSRTVAPFDPSTVPVVVRPTASASTATQATLTTERVGDATIVTVRGRLSEAFKGEALGSALAGRVVVDLADVERVTSYGVREWLAMLAAAKNVTSLAFARCSEAVVNQLGMIRKFAGTAHVVSFFAPYQCSGCGEPFERLFDVERDRDAILEASPPVATCPSCAAAGRFDDEAETYFGFARAHAGEPVEPAVRKALAHVGRTKPEVRKDPVDKSVEGNVTRIRLQTKLASDVRWPKILDGIEGALVLDLGLAGSPDAESSRSLERALVALPSDVVSTTIERCPEDVLVRLETLRATARFTLASALMNGHCATCDVPRPAFVPLSEHRDAILHGRPISVPCKRCSGALTIPRLALLGAFFKDHNARLQASVGESERGPVSTSGSVASIARSGPTSFRVETALAAGALVVGLVALGVVSLGHTSAPVVAPAPSASAGIVAAAGAERPSPGPEVEALPPAWTERALAIEGESIYLVGRADRGAKGEGAVTQARGAAILRLLQEVAKDLVGTPIHELVTTRVHGEAPASSAAVVERFLAQCGTFATPERVDAWLPAAGEGAVRFKLGVAAYRSAVAFYRETATVQGMTVGRVFPTLERSFHTEGDLVVLGLQKGRLAEGVGIRVGDVVLAVDGRQVAGPESFARAANEAWARVAVRGALSMEIESGGARHLVRFYKAPQAP